MLLKMDEGRSSLLSRGLFWLDRSRTAGLWLGAGVGLGLGAGAAYLGLPYGLPLGVLALGGAALLGLTGSAITVGIPETERDEGPSRPTPRE